MVPPTQIMTLIQIIISSLVQGLTEFLPISSSAHLILVPILTHWQDQGLAFDVAVHVGTLIAVIMYFRKELRTMLQDWWQSCIQRQRIGDSRLAWAVIWATLPTCIAGLLLYDLVNTVLRSPLVIAWATIGFGILLGFADIKGKRVRNEHSIQWKDVLIISMAQALALIPGTSRSGITMTAGLILGLTREASARFSFLLSIPIIFMAGGYEATRLIHTDGINWTIMILGALLSGITAYCCIHLFLKLLRRIGMLPFVLYRLVLGIFLLYIFI